MREAIVARLGYNPFSERAQRLVRTRVDRTRSGLTADVTLYGKDGKRLGEQRLSSTGSDCQELADSLALAVSIAIDPVRGTLGAPTPPAIQEPPRTVATPLPPAHPSPEHASDAARPPAKTSATAALVGLGPFASFGKLPAPTAGAALIVGLRVGAIGLYVDGRADLGASMASQTGQVEARMFSASIAPCLHLGPVLGCPTFTAGRLHAEGSGVDVPREAAATYLAVGLRGGADLPLTRALFLRGQLEADVALSGATLRLDHRDVWTSSPLAFSSLILLGGALRR